MKNIAYTLIDFNGTLVDDAEIAVQAVNHMLTTVYRTPAITLERFRDTFRTPWQEFYYDIGVRGAIDVHTHQVEYQRVYRALSQKRLRLRANAPEALASLKEKKLKLAVLSSRNIEDLTRELTLLGVHPLFDAVIGEDGLHNDGTKGHKRADHAIQALGITDPSRVALIGDMILDIRTAQENGFVSIALTGGWQSTERLRAERPDYLVDSFQEIQQLFE